MRKLIAAMCGAWLGLALALPAVTLAETAATPNAADDAAVQQEEAAINESFGQNGAGRAQQLATQFGVEQAKVEDLRGKTGWGGATIQLAMAQKLAQSDPATYPTTADALTKIEAMRAENKGYGVIAKELGFKLGPVIRQARVVRNDARRAAREAARGEHPAKMRGERPAKAERPARAEHAPKPEKPAHP